MPYGEVVEVERLTPRMVRIVLGGDGLADYEPCGFTDQYVNAFFIPDGAPYSVPFDVDAARDAEPALRPLGRRYTIRWWDPEARRVAIDFVVHGDVGSAGRWANNAEVGDLLQFSGPSGGYAPDASADWYLMVGDESALPAIAASLERVPADRRAIAVIVVDDADHELPLRCPGELDVRWVHRVDEPGDHELVVRAVGQLAFPDGRPDVFVHGEAAEVRAIRKLLFGGHGLDRHGTSISPYWRRAHSDEEWRQVKRDWLAEQALDV